MYTRKESFSVYTNIPRREAPGAYLSGHNQTRFIVYMRRILYVFTQENERCSDWLISRGVALFTPMPSRENESCSERHLPPPSVTWNRSPPLGPPEGSRRARGAKERKNNLALIPSPKINHSYCMRPPGRPSSRQTTTSRHTTPPRRSITSRQTTNTSRQTTSQHTTTSTKIV